MNKYQRNIKQIELKKECATMHFLNKFDEEAIELIEAIDPIKSMINRKMILEEIKQTKWWEDFIGEYSDVLNVLKYLQYLLKIDMDITKAIIEQKQDIAFNKGKK